MRSLRLGDGKSWMGSKAWRLAKLALLLSLGLSILKEPDQLLDYL